MKLTDLLAFPVRSDDYGIYIWDEKTHMVADTHRDDKDGVLLVCADALNRSEGFDNKNLPLDYLIKLPVKYDPEQIEVVDRDGNEVLRVRGWGRLQHLGEKEGIEAQNLIGQAFADAINAKKC